MKLDVPTGRSRLGHAPNSSASAMTGLVPGDSHPHIMSFPPSSSTNPAQPLWLPMGTPTTLKALRAMCGRPLGCKRKSEKSDGRYDCDHVCGLCRRGTMSAGPDGVRDPLPSNDAASKAAVRNGFCGSSVRPIVISFSSFTPASTRGSRGHRLMPATRRARHRDPCRMGHLVVQSRPKPLGGSIA